MATTRVQFEGLSELQIAGALGPLAASAGESLPLRLEELAELLNVRPNWAMQILELLEELDYLVREGPTRRRTFRIRPKGEGWAAEHSPAAQRQNDYAWRNDLFRPHHPDWRAQGLPIWWRRFLEAPLTAAFLRALPSDPSHEAPLNLRVIARNHGFNLIIAGSVARQLEAIGFLRRPLNNRWNRVSLTTKGLLWLMIWDEDTRAAEFELQMARTAAAVPAA